MTYQHLGAEECAIQLKRANKRAYASVVVAALAVGVLVLAMPVTDSQKALLILVELAMALAAAVGVRILGGNIHLEELSAAGYKEAFKIAHRNPAAAAELRGWTERSRFLAVRDLLELRTIASGQASIDARRAQGSSPIEQFRLTMVSGVSNLNDVVVGTFYDEQWANLAGEHFLALDRLDAPEFASFRVEPAT